MNNKTAKVVYKLGNHDIIQFHTKHDDYVKRTKVLVLTVSEDGKWKEIKIPWDEIRTVTFSN